MKSFLAGSVVNGEGTFYSDLDIVVIYGKLDQAYRESFIFDEWPIEAFVHDPETLKYFFEEVDAKSGAPSLMNMVLYSEPIPEASMLVDELRQLAQEVLLKGPPAWDKDLIDRARYELTDLLDDLREPRDSAEKMATLCALYPKVANFYLRSSAKWSGSNKGIIRQLKSEYPEFFKDFDRRFQSAFRDSSTSGIIVLVESILAPFGGLLFDGYKLDAPKDWRKE